MHTHEWQKRDGKYWRKDGKRDEGLLKEEEQVAVLDEVIKAQTFVLKDTYTEQSSEETQH